MEYDILCVYGGRGACVYVTTSAFTEYCVYQGSGTGKITSVARSSDVCEVIQHQHRHGFESKGLNGSVAWLDCPVIKYLSSCCLALWRTPVLGLAMDHIVVGKRSFRPICNTLACRLLVQLCSGSACLAHICLGAESQ